MVSTTSQGRGQVAVLKYTWYLVEKMSVARGATFLSTALLGAIVRLC